MQINLAPDLSLLAIMVIFMLNYLIVRKFFLQPISEVLDARETETKSAERLYEEALARFSEATAQTEAQLQAAKREAAQVRERFRGEAGAYRQQVVEQTNTEARGQLGEAEKKLSQDVAVAREQIVRDSDQLARLAAERILGRAV
jgi:F-type H+-transporting ATPase subunit b